MTEKSEKRWSALEAQGKEVRLFSPGGSSWVVFRCETEKIAQHIVRELKYWSKSALEDAEVERLWRAGD